MNLPFFRKKSSPAPAAPAQAELSRHGDEPDLSIVDALTIAGILEEFVQARSKLSAHAPDGRYLGFAILLSCEGGKLALRVTPPEAGRAVSGPLDLNVAGSSAKGAFLFTLRAREGEFSDLWQAEFPRKVVQVHSRRYRRIKSIRGPAHFASLTFPGAPEGMKIIDLSEEGAELEVAGMMRPAWPVTAGTLTLDHHAIPVPGIHLIHSSRTDQGTWRVGVSLLGIDPAAMRIFRRWLDAAETSGRHSVR